MRRVLIPLDIESPRQRPAAIANVARLDGRTMGTSWSVAIAGVAQGALAPLRHAIEATLDGIIAQMSPWEPASDISRFNARASGTWHRLPGDFVTVLDCALAVARDSDGAYDPTIGAVIDLWGFGPPGKRDAPGEREIAAALANAGWQRLARDGIKIMQPGGLHLDLSAIAKGYAVDRVAACLDRFGLTDHLVEIGGELRGRGVKPDGTPWWVALEQPYAMASETVVALHSLSIATSGDQQRYIDHGGERLPHILDPRNGRPVQNGTASVTVLHTDCMLADAWATALMVPPPRDALALATAQNLAARIWVRRGTEWDELMTPAFAAMLD